MGKSNLSQGELDDDQALEQSNLGSPNDGEQEQLPEESSAWDEDESYEEAPWLEENSSAYRRKSNLITMVIFAAILGWTGLYAKVRYESMIADASASLWVSLLFEWIVPVLLIVIIWQLSIRTGKAEQARFNSAANMLSRESADLEERLSSVNRELSMARDFLAAQSRDLESLGRVATDRVNSSAEKLQDLIDQNSDKLENVNEVSASAIANMEQLREQLPVIANSARDMTSQLGNVGNVAQDQMGRLSTGFADLKTFNESSEEHVKRIDAIVSEALSSLENQASKIGNDATTTFVNLSQQSDEFHRHLYERDQKVIETSKLRASELTSFLEDRYARLEEIEQKSIHTMRERVLKMIKEIDALLADMGQRRDTTTQQVSTAIAELEQRLGQATDTISELDASAIEAAHTRLLSLIESTKQAEQQILQRREKFDAQVSEQQVAEQERERDAIAKLEERLAGLDERIDGSQANHLTQIEQFVERSEGLAGRVEKIDEEMARLHLQSSDLSENIGQSAETLSERLANSQELLETNEEKIARITDKSAELLALIESGSEQAKNELQVTISSAGERMSAVKSDAETTQQLVKTAQESGQALSTGLEQVTGEGGQALELLSQLEARLTEVSAKSETLSEQSRGELQKSINALMDASSDAFEGLREKQGNAINDIANSIAEQSQESLAKALGESARKTIVEMEEATARANAVGRETTVQLRDQLSRVNELTGNLEQRLAAAQDRAEEQVNNDFTHRVALITEALNSSAIDITRGFETEVSDTQWASYLRGDRGIFTRRAVRLLEKQEEKSVLAVYEEDEEFRANVNRYVHDFEGMLRQVLSTRDGNTMAITLLSSEIGKLYVSLAQAIERLRE